MASYYRVITNPRGGKLAFIRETLPATDIDYDAYIKRTKHDIDVARIDLFQIKQFRGDYIQRSTALEETFRTRAVNLKKYAPHFRLQSTRFSVKRMMAATGRLEDEATWLVSKLVEQLGNLEKERGEQWLGAGRWVREIWMFSVGAWHSSDN